MKNVAGKPILADHMVAFVGDGTAPSWPGAHFDDARNWALVSSIVGDGHAHVTHLFVATPIRERLLAYAAKIGASPAIRSKAAEVLAQPHGSLPHDDHFHVRIACPSGHGRSASSSRSRSITATARRASHRMAIRRTRARRGTRRERDTRRSRRHPPRRRRTRRHALRPRSPPLRRKPAAQAAESREESAKSESSIPSLSPSVPGLDSAVIPTPLTGVRSTWGTAKDLPPPAKADPISDPDGVLEHN